MSAPSLSSERFGTTLGAQSRTGVVTNSLAAPARDPLAKLMWEVSPQSGAWSRAPVGQNDEASSKVQAPSADLLVDLGFDGLVADPVRPLVTLIH